MATSKNFQTRLSKLVKESGYNNTELRSFINIGSSSLTNALCYGVIPTPKTLIKIADHFKVSINYLLGSSNSNDFIEGERTASFYERLLLLTEEKGITFYKVAADCAFNGGIISKWFKKGYLPSLEILELLCDYFSVSPDYLLGRSDFRK